MPSKVVWVIGNSFVRRAAYHLQQQRTSKPTGLKNVLFRWCGIGSLRISQLRQLVEEMRGREGLQFPNLIIVHVGGDDLVGLGRRGTREALLCEVAWLGRAFPEVVIAWSHIIPRRKWGLNVRSRALNVSARRLNGEMTKLCQEPGQLWNIAHKLIKVDHMFHRDGVHLSDMGTDFFIDCIWAFTQKFFSGKSKGLLGPGLSRGA